MAIHGRKRENLTYEKLFEKITEYDVYRYYLGREFEVGNVIHSPFRQENNPSFFIGNKGGFLHHVDLANSTYRGNCVHFVMQLYHLNYNDALERISDDLIAKTNIHIVSSPKKDVSVKREHTLIQVITKPFDTADLAYWNQFHLDLKDLKADEVYSVKTLYINRQKWPKSVTELCFGYLYDDKWKIYFPYGDKAKNGKWKSSVALITMDGLENLNNCDTGLILKSKKDKMVARKFLLPCAASVQNESIGAISPENINYIQENVTHPYLIFDNDKAGVESCTYYNQFGFDYWNVPKEYQKEGIKDIAEFVAKYGPDKLREEISKKIVL